MKLSKTQLNSLVLVTLLATLGTKPSRSDQYQPEAIPEPAPYQQPVRMHPPFHPSPVTIGDASHYSPPDFTNYIDVKARKHAFYEYLLPQIYEANEEVMMERKWLLGLASNLVEGQALTEFQRAELAKVERRYFLRRPAEGDVARVADLLLRVDVVPASLVLAQAAKESGWGTSRFAREGNNFFGIWCFFDGCGITPSNRIEGLRHEVAMFDTVSDGVRYYIRTINTHVAYDELRKMRADARRQSGMLTGDELAKGLIRYSERGVAYVKEIQTMIRYNQLQRFTRPYRV